MPFALLIIGIVMVITAARGTFRDLGTLLKGDFTGPNNFFYWLIAIGVLGAIGYNDKARAFSRACMSLVLIVLILGNGAFFAQLMAAVGGADGGTSAGSGAVGNALDETPAPQSSGGGAGGGGTGTAAGDPLSSAQTALGAVGALSGFVGASNISGAVAGISGTLGKVSGGLSKLKGLFG